MTASSSSATLLQARLADWEATLKDVSNSGYASSEESLNTDDVSIFVQDGAIKYKEHNADSFTIENLRNIPGKTMHFRSARVARFAEANSLETSRVEALSMAIYSGSIRITGPYACVNHFGTYPDDSTPEITADTPVPIKILRGQTVQAIVEAHEVIVAKKVRKKIYTCHFKSQYSPSDPVRRLSSQRIYFAGVGPEQPDWRNTAGQHYGEMQSNMDLPPSMEIKTERVAVSIFGLTNGEIMTMFRDYLDGVHLKYRPAQFHTIRTLTPIYWMPEKQVKLPVLWESELDGRHVTVYSAEAVEVTWQHETWIWLSYYDFAMDRCMHGDVMQKAARQFKNLTLASYAKMINATTLDVVAAFQRKGESVEQSVGGHACYLFQKEGRLAKDWVRAKPMTRDELEGVALVATPGGDYSLRTSKKVMYTRREDGVWHIDPEGDTACVPGPDLVGAENASGAGPELPATSWRGNTDGRKTSLMRCDGSVRCFAYHVQYCNDAL